MAMNASAKECGVCNEEFDEEVRCPRIFPCNHTLCSSCIDNLVRCNKKQCPFCRRDFMANCSSDVMKNHTMMELMKYISVVEGLSSKPAPVDRVPPRKKKIENLKKETLETSSLYLVNCQKAEKQIEKTLKEITNLEINIKEENTRIENDVFPKLQNVISQNNKMLEDLRRTKNNMKDQMKELKGKDKQLKKIKENFAICKAETFSETAALLDEVEETNTAIGCWIENFKKIISEEEKTLRTTEKVIRRIKEKVNILLEVLNSEEERGEEEGEEGEDEEEEIASISGMAAMAIQEDNLPTQITTETLREMNAQVKRLVDQGRLYAIQHHDGRRRFARISYSEDEKLCLHHLKEEPLPFNVHVIDHEDVMRLVDPSSRLVFLELFDGRSTLGRLFIRLHPRTNIATQFECLCIGEKGPSYANTNILGMWGKGSVDECVRWGDYESNDSRGGKPLVPGMWEVMRWESSLSGSVVEWRLGGKAEAAQFLIYTRDNPARKLSSPLIGMVEEGLNVLTEAISHYYRNINQISIKDCGIVLPR